VLGHLRDLNFVPKLLNKPFFRGENITYAMSLCRGVHPCTFNTVAELQAFVKSLLLTLHQLHKRNIVHNDIKEHNILWDYATTVVSLIDFGCATTIHGETHAHTPGYCAPDRVKTPASDVYSAGIVLFNVTLRVAIRSTQQAIELSQCENLAQAMKWKLKHQAISHGEATLCSEKSLDLARRMIVKDASRRISIESALKHAFFESTTPVSPTKHIKSLTTLVLPVDNINVLA
jgi:serine/threonine protein kinase